MQTVGVVATAGAATATAAKVASTEVDQDEGKSVASSARAEEDAVGMAPVEVAAQAVVVTTA